MTLSSKAKWITENFPYFYLAAMGAALLVLIALKLAASRGYADTGTVDFFLTLMGIAFVVLLIGLIFPKIRNGQSLIPIGQYEPKMYPIQRIGKNVNVAFAVSLVAAILFATISGFIIFKSSHSLFPARPFFSERLSFAPGSNPVLAFFFGGINFLGGVVRAFMEALPPTLAENTLVLMLPYGVIWHLARAVPAISKLPMGLSWIIPFLLGFAVVVLIFPIYHTLAYQGVQPAYSNVFWFVFFNLLIAALTGFPLTLDLVHFVNNFLVSFTNSYSIAAVAPPVMIAGFAFAQFMRKPPELDAKHIRKVGGNRKTDGQRRKK